MIVQLLTSSCFVRSMILSISIDVHLWMQETYVEDKLVKEAHYSLWVGRRTFPTTIKSALSVGHMFRPLKPAVDSIPAASVHHRDLLVKDVPAMREVNLSSHTILTLALGELCQNQYKNGGGSLCPTMSLRNAAPETDVSDGILSGVRLIKSPPVGVSG
jgi:hypothetical protein